MAILTARWPPYPLPFQRGQNCQPGMSELLAQSSANLATLYGHINGGATVGGTPNPAPINPSGDYGHDHSGGDFGRPFFRSVLAVTMDGTSAVAGVMARGAGNYLTLPEDEDSRVTSSGLHEIPCLVPPCDPVHGAYVRLGISLRVRLQSTALIAGDALTLRVWSQWSGEEPQKVTLEVPAPQTTGDKQIEGGEEMRIRVLPGAVNVLHVQAKVARTTGGSARGAQIYVRELELGVYSV